MDKIQTTEPFKVMINNPDEYNLRLTYPTENLLVHDFHHSHIINLEKFLQGIDQLTTNPETLIVFFGLYQNLREQDAYPWLEMLDQYYRSRPNPMILFNGRLTSDSPELVNQLSIPYRDWETDRKSTRLNSSHSAKYRMPSSA